MRLGTHNKLKVAEVERITEPGFYGDGGGLYLQITPRGSRSWIFRYTRNGRSHMMGLGPTHLVGLGEARDKAHEHRRQLFDGIDPLAAKRSARARASSAPTFLQAATSYIKAHAPTWGNPKHVAQWHMTLLGNTPQGEPTEHNYCKLLHPMPVNEIDTPLILRVLEPIWHSKTETASRIRGRIEAVLGAETVKGHRQGDNPAKWTNHLDHLLASKSKLTEDRHYPALDYHELPAFMRDLQQQDGVAARALEFLIYTSTRTGDIIGQDREDKPPMRWEHVDLDAARWDIPKTKTGVEHRVPLSSAAIAVLRHMQQQQQSDLVFPGQNPDAPLSNASMAAVIDRINKQRSKQKLKPYIDRKQDGRQVTVHGMRATFKSWSGDETDADGAVVEACLTHEISNELEAAYRRSDFLRKRKTLMQQWADYAQHGATASATVLSFRKA
jgi:integrase